MKKNSVEWWDAKRRPKGKILSPMRSIRKHCLECMGYVAVEVEACSAPECWLYPFRLGKDPRREGREMTEAQKIAAKRSGERLRRLKSDKPSGL